MNRLYLLPLLLSVTLVTGCDVFDDDDKKRRPAASGEIGFTALFDDAFARDPNGEPVTINDRTIEDDSNESTFDNYLN
ncbi:hypothetical protein [Allohahella sp. A8]|uniref:hypothetical protein n=1 Tax=Allohahella sp. A8 TaxID=3141461 RepID=UPI000C0A29F3|nr:hypothetical protein [Hahellaceae bacterium]|tara:strand:+ start:9557 stop:9790 length:234 start_codon:yes stop_codon:yes gene_type:complete